MWLTKDGMKLTNAINGNSNTKLQSRKTGKNTNSRDGCLADTTFRMQRAKQGLNGFLQLETA